jgi:hypothetical protein
VVTTADEEPQPTGAVAQLGGVIRETTDRATSIVTNGERRLVVPLLLISIASMSLVSVTDPFMAAVSLVCLVTLAMWCAVEVLHKR